MSKESKNEIKKLPKFYEMLTKLFDISALDAKEEIQKLLYPNKRAKN